LLNQRAYVPSRFVLAVLAVALLTPTLVRSPAVADDLATATAGGLKAAGLITAPVPDEPGTKRLAGSDRYATAAAIVQDSFPAGPVPVVFVSAGEAYADALAGGPAADMLGGPVLRSPGPAFRR